MICFVHACKPSISFAIRPNLYLSTGCSMSVLPKASLLRAQSIASSRQMRAPRIAWNTIQSLSWLKLLIIYLKPWPSVPMRYSIGTLTSSNVTYVVALMLPVPIEIGRVLMPSAKRGMSNKETPPRRSCQFGQQSVFKVCQKGGPRWWQVLGC